MLARSARRPCPSRRSQHGLIVVFVAILAIVIFGFVGLAVDAAHIQSAGSQLQNAADAAALAAAAKVHLEGLTGGSLGTYAVTRKAATDIAVLNLAAEKTVTLKANASNDASGDVVVGFWNNEDHTFTPNLVLPNAVKVTARLSGDSAAGALPLTFGSMFGAATSDVERTAIASLDFEPNAFIHVLDPSGKGTLKLSGTADIQCAEGKVQVDSSNSCAIDFNGTPTLTAAKTTVHGGSCAASGCIQGPLVQNGPVEADPLADILPTTTDWNTVKAAMAKPLGATGAIAAAGVFTPGYYPKGLSINNSTTVTLLPGTYMFGDDLSMSGQTLLSGAGVTILMDKGAKVSVGGGASLVLTPPVAGPYEGLTVMFHRETTGGSVCSIGGGGAISFEGTLYCPKGEVDLGGTSGLQQFGQIVCWHLSCSGTPQITGDDIVPPKATGPVCLVQ
ncbi:MAG TPA: pilus assembly protein TadG-related protein [Planctomycetota bacterium]|nr:pilus assembly protein TadG-related protein [Planctomycetota bacterium]